MSEMSKPYYSVEEIASIFSRAGYKAEIDVLSSGGKVIRSSASGHNFSVYLYAPKDQPEHVRSIQFAYAVARKPSIQAANAWNQEKRFGKAYLDEEGDLCLEWDCVVTFASPAFIKECLEWWEIILGQINDLR